jgi:hypothetical protein
MAKAKSQPEQLKGSPLSAFLQHQANALEETGKALVSLLPKEFREHTNKACEEGKAGFDALFDGVIDGVQRGLGRLRSAAKADEDDTGKSKVKVEVD